MSAAEALAVGAVFGDATVLADTANLDRATWLQLRRAGIGGSDAAVITGHSPYKTPLALYYEKTGELDDTEAGEAAAWGNRLEPVVADTFAEETGLYVVEHKVLFRHTTHHWMLGNVDRFVIEDDAVAVLEVKTTGAHMAEEWADDQVPVRHQLQVQHYLGVCGLSHAYVAALIGGQRMLTRRIERDDEAIAWLIELEAQFWQRVVDRRPPPADGHEATSEAIKARFADVDAEPVDLPAETELLIRRYQAAKAEQKTVKERVDELGNHLKLLLGEHQVGLIDGQPAVTWKQSSTSSIDADALRAAHPDIAEQFTRRGTTRRLNIPKRKSA